jgi:CDP-glucose 4,6-dehydratase
MRLAEELLAGAPGAGRFATAYNFGPNQEDARPVSWIAERMTRYWGDGASWVLDDDKGPHEAGYLRLDISRARRDLGWEPLLRLDAALEWLVQWYRAWRSSPESIPQITISQITRYRALIQAKKDVAAPQEHKA